MQITELKHHPGSVRWRVLEHTGKGEEAAGLGQHRHAGATAQPFSNQLSFLHCFKIKKTNNKKKKIKNIQLLSKPFLLETLTRAGRSRQAALHTPCGTGSSRAEKYTFSHRIGDLVSSMLGRLPWGGVQEPCPRRMEQDGAGLAAGPWQGGRGFFPAPFQLGAAVAALPSHPRQEPQHRGREGSAGATLTPHPSLPATARAGARSEVGGTGRAPEGAGSWLCPLLTTAESRDEAAAISHCQAGASGGHTHAGLARQDTPSSHHPPHPRREEQECPALWRGMWSCQGMWNGLSSTSNLCGDLRGARVLPVQNRDCGVGGALPRHRALPPSPQPLLLC